MYEAFFAGRLASEAVLELPAGGRVARCLRAEAGRHLAVHLWAAWSLRAALDRFPRTTYALAKGSLVWPVVEKLVTGELPDVRATRGLARAPLKAISLLARAAGDPGVAYKPAYGNPAGPALRCAGGELPLTTLDGGARIITEPLPSVRSAAIGIWIGAGSRDEDDAHAGLSHFLEHLLFKGTQSYSALEIAEIVRHAMAS